MQILFESSNEIFGSNSSLPKLDHRVPNYIRSATPKVEKFNPYSLLLADGKPGNFYYSEEKKIFIISLGITNFAEDSLNLMSIQISLCSLSEAVSYPAIVYQSIAQTRKRIGNDDIQNRKAASNFARSLVKKASFGKDYDEMQKIIKDSLEIARKWNH